MQDMILCIIFVTRSSTYMYTLCLLGGVSTFYAFTYTLSPLPSLPPFLYVQLQSTRRQEKMANQPF